MIPRSLFPVPIPRFPIPCFKDSLWGSFQKPPYDDTQGITDLKMGKNRGKELKNM